MILKSYSYNVDIAKIFGINCAVFIQLLIEHNYNISINREEIFEAIGLDISKQGEVERSLEDSKVLTIRTNRNGNNGYKLNVDLLTSMLQNYTAYNSFIKQNDGIKVDKKVSKQDRATSQINKLKSYIVCEDSKFRQYWGDWIDAVYTKENGRFPNKASIHIAEQELNSYTDSDNIKENIIFIAIKNGYRDITWAISKYEQEHNKDASINFISYNDIKSDGKNIVDEEF